MAFAPIYHIPTFSPAQMNPLNNYWLWDLNTLSSPGVEASPWIITGDSWNEESKETSKTKGKKVTERKRNKQVFKPKFIEKAEDLHKKLVRQEVSDRKIYSASSKVSVPEGQNLSKPRAKYIGVSKNGKNWQSLIVINNIKVYLGTYKTQIEAAVMFDFHSILMKGDKARVNNDYTARQVLEMVEIFQKWGGEFNPQKFVQVTQKL